MVGVVGIRDSFERGDMLVFMNFWYFFYVQKRLFMRSAKSSEDAELRTCGKNYFGFPSSTCLGNV